MAKLSLSSKKYNPKGYNTSTRKAMDASGARYSTTSSKGVTDFYNSSNDVEAGVAPIKTTDATGNVITADSLRKNGKIELPPVPGAQNVGNMVTANNAGLANPMYNITADTKGTLSVQSPSQTTGTSADTTGFDSIFKSYLSQSQDIEPVSSADIYAKEYKAQKVAQKQQEVSNYASQLNTIVANRDANLLRVEGQGRGIPEAIIGGQQAQINKEAAIAALPVQAQLAAAQDNLALATQHLNTMVQLKTQDAQARYQYKTKLLDSVYQFATAQEQRRLDALKVQEDRKYQETQDFIKTQNAALTNALSQGAPSSVYNAIASATDTKSVIMAAGAYNGDVLAQQIKRQQLTNAQLEGQKKQQELNAPSTATGTLSGKPQTEGQAKAQGFADRLKEAEQTLVDSDKFGSVFARGGILPNFLKSEDRQKFEQSQRNFINAVLRRESGAVISDEEFDNARQQYFPQPGDGDGVLAQKRANRNTVINSFYREANVARPVAAGDIIESGGVRYRVADDGVTLEEI